ncbi:hypothetical protein DB88DRAFT_471319 [Papiliotrema laurentii]|uniref:Uncharacterized protein n=1 Tax=Papiliotrema laurentii TaxID=5418 RepID=A0AAD9FV75_PAPLA|nr:hypothetical protein DB88DRAFT_471319 [Papiliotrema laurentii]
MIAWKSKTVKEYVYNGLLHSVGFYIASAGFMLLLKFTGKATHGSFWRQTLFVLLLALELSLVLSPTPASDTLPFLPMLSSLAPRGLTNTPQFIWIRRLHRLWASLSIGISQLAGVWAEPNQSLKEEEVWHRIDTLATGIVSEAASQFHNEVAPLLTASSDPIAAQYAMLAGIEQLMVDATVSSHPAVRPAWKNALSKSRARHPGPAHPHAQRPPPSRLSMAHTLQLATHTPLPPSPPASPRPGSMVVE